ncbi:MAG: hypothetical protein LBP69_03430 [Treponema sp.]|jgi:hypothetical protein|nr:hypothetical protein [Treponema sp.]
MAEKKGPSIYDDRSNIGSSEELDEYGVWVKSEPQELSSAMPEMEELPDFDDEMTGSMDLPNFDDTEAPAEMSDFVPEEIEFEEIPEDSDFPEGQNPVEVDKDGFTEVSMNDFLDEEELESVNRSIDIGDLDNIPDFPEDVPEAPMEHKTPAGVREAGSSGVPDNSLSNQLLMKIAEELSSIKKELSSLKSELSLVRSVHAENQDAHDAAGGGFFDEEDDEKIALTGDELDNILNTANFTEEAGSGETVGEDLASFEKPDENTEDGAENDLPLSSKPDIIPDIIIEDNEAEVPSGPRETAEEMTDDFDISLDLSKDLTADENTVAEIPVLDSDDGLASLREEGFNPMTRVDGDTSYLEEDPLASVSEDEQIDFSSAVIDEPDLSSQITENPIKDPVIENISIDIDMEEPEAFEAQSGDFTIENEETMEIPVTEEPLIDDFFPISESASDTPAPVSEEPDNFAVEPMADEGTDDFAVEPMADEGTDNFAVEPPAGTDDFTAAPLVTEGTDTFTAEPPAAEGIVSVPEHEDESGIPSNLKQELKTVLSYMDQLLESLPEDKIEEFAKSEYFDTYKKLFEELGLV